jgi:hypothetical protein
MEKNTREGKLPGVMTTGVTGAPQPVSLRAATPPLSPLCCITFCELNIWAPPATCFHPVGACGSSLLFFTPRGVYKMNVPVEPAHPLWNDGESSACH